MISSSDKTALSFESSLVLLMFYLFGESIAQENTDLSLLFSEQPRNLDRLLAIYMRPLCHLAEILIYYSKSSRNEGA